MKNLKKILLSLLCLPALAFAQAGDSTVSGWLNNYNTSNSSSIIAPETAVQSAGTIRGGSKFICTAFVMHNAGDGRGEGMYSYFSATNQTHTVQPSQISPGWYQDVHNCTGPYY